ncbi:5-hydroxytryptamine receptor 3A-like isoform X1 [Amphiprion ocellaris]|uniref:Uncharacterized protein n=1 Tax=Amphiprion ocellaris TaxID=80972 RepID=A0AAQ5XKR7_AMPOC|nr:5-hydroxytryptamine receptor 3A-like isoform X1 [Amphiprion ocellaris]
MKPASNATPTFNDFEKPSSINSGSAGIISRPQRQLGCSLTLTAMMLAGFFFLLLLTGERTSSSELPELHDNHHKSNHSFQEIPGGNTSSSELYDDQQASNQSLEEMSGGNTSNSELYDDQQAKNQSSEEMSGEGLSSEVFIHTVPGRNIPSHEDHSKTCSIWDIVDHLNLTKDTDKYVVTRPVRDHTSHTLIYITMMIYAILDVRESDQVFISYVWIVLEWDNEHIWWDPDRFCGLKHIIVPTKHLWMPDLTTEEMIEKDKVRPSPYLKINYYGWIDYRNDQVMLTTCRMTAYNFPFDIQRCTISFKSILHSDKEIQLLFNTNNTAITERSRKVMRTQYEWLFIDMTATEETNDILGFNQTTIIYTITMKRRSALYVANFLLPVLFFLCLDLASLLISNRGGEKLSFKVTVMLAVTVMQLILNEILPASSDRIPLIAIYCIGVFGMMMISLMETIFVTYLMEKDFQDDQIDRDRSLNESREDKLDKGNFHSCFREMKKWTHCVSFNNGSADQPPHVGEEGSSQLTEVSVALEKVSDELGEIDRKMILLSSNKEEKPGYWTRMAKKIDKAFSIVYVMSVFLFLVVIFSVWIPKPK